MESASLNTESRIPNTVQGQLGTIYAIYFP
jgi:hypothetical protein